MPDGKDRALVAIAASALAFGALGDAVVDETGLVNSNECGGSESRISCGELNSAGVVAVSSVTNDDAAATCVLAASPAAPSKDIRLEDRQFVDDIRVEATVSINACRRIDDGDGFKVLKDACEDSFARAGAEYELGRWSAAAMAYSNLIARVEGLKRLDEKRKKAADMAPSKEPPLIAPAVIRVQLPQPDMEVARLETKVNSLFKTADELAGEERWRECLAVANSILEIEPDNGRAKRLKARAENGIQTAETPAFATPQNTIRGTRDANGLVPFNQDKPKDDWRHRQGTQFFK